VKRSRWLIVAGACAFVLFLAAQLPAAVAAGWLGGEKLRLNSPSGTIWSGAAGSVQAGPLRLGATNWSLSIPALLRGELRADMVARLGGEAQAAGSVARSLTGAWSCTACRFEGPASTLWPLFPALKAVTGRMALDVAALEVRDAWPTRVVATAKLASTLPGTAAAAAAGGAATASFEAMVSADPVPADGVIEATITDAGGPLQLTARLSITPPGNFEFAGRLKAGPGAPAEVATAIAALGPRAGDGSTELSLTGSF
jgi:hypothetical protein